MNLTEVHAKTSQMQFCVICDGPTEAVTKWYEYEYFSDVLQRIRTGVCLECCKDQGTVVDWKEHE